MFWGKIIETHRISFSVIVGRFISRDSSAGMHSCELTFSYCYLRMRGAIPTFFHKFSRCCIYMTENVTSLVFFSFLIPFLACETETLEKKHLRPHNDAIIFRALMIISQYGNSSRAGESGFRALVEARNFFSTSKLTEKLQESWTFLFLTDLGYYTEVKCSKHGENIRPL
jgi:hypothetical protein